MTKIRTRVVAALAGLSLLLAGCGSGDSGLSGGGGDTKQRKGTLTLWHYYGPEDSPTGGPLFRLVDRYEKEHKTKVEVRHIPFEDFSRTLLQSAAGNDLPDIAVLNAFQTQSMAEAGVIADLSDRVGKWGQQDAYYPKIWSTTQYDGKTYGVPHVADAYALYYNKALFAKAKLAPPKTWAELETTAKKLSGAGERGLAVSGIEGDEGATALIIRMLAAGGDVTKLTSAADRKALAQVKKLVDDGSLSKGFLTWNEEDAKNQFAGGRAAMMINSATYVNILRKENPDLDWGVALLPKDQREATFLSAENLTVAEGSPNADAAWKLIEWMQRPDVLKEYLPDRNKLSTRADVAKGETDADRKVFAQQLEHAWAPEGDLAKVSSEVFSHVQEALQSAISGGASVDDALKDAQGRVDKALEGAK